MKKFFFLLFLLALPLISSADIGYVVKNHNYVEETITNILDENSYDYEIAEYSEANLSNYKILLVNDRINGIDVNNHKSIVIHSSYYKNWSESLGSISSSHSLKVYNPESVVSEFIGEFPAYTQGSIPAYYLSRKKYDSNKVTSVSYNNPFDYVIAYKKNPRRIFFGITEPEYWSEDTKNIFIESIEWLFHGEDSDNDGYFSENDCDDNNPDVWRYLEGYLDSDNDSYGSGELLDVCSGLELRENYSLINGDCDDNDSLVNPDFEEIPYDGKDNDCSNGDLTDVDGDGYDSVLVGGSDCDDNDSLVNPDSENVYKNCKNDAPFLKDFENLVFKENEIVEIIVNVSDPENDSLEYFINYSGFSLNENIFSWETNYEDEGNYIFEITVSDGEFETSKNIEIEILKENQAPYCSNIEDIEWNEDENYTLDLNEYCFDDDGDYIVFYVNKTSSDENISVKRSEGLIFFNSTKDWYGEDWIIFGVSDGDDYNLTNKIELKVNPINDAPYVLKEIGNITWEEDSNLTEYLDLNDYFKDIDSELNFDYEGGDINLVLEDSLVSFYPEKDWYGEESVYFIASDGEYEINLSVLLKVLNQNEAPVFNELNCENNISEDVNYNCSLNSSDFENDEVYYFVSQENNLKCSFNGSLLNYISYEDYNGYASCLLRVSDSHGYSELLFEVNISNTNDAPEISDFSPSQKNVKILEGNSEIFRVNAFDIDSGFNVNWLLDNESVSLDENYRFKQEIGDYNLSVKISDNESFVFNEWLINVKPISDFSCSEVNGFVCNENQVCNGNKLNVKNSVCCDIPCSIKPPEFNEIKERRNNSDDIEFDFIEPDDENFEFNEIIEVELEIESNTEDEFDVEVYLYSLEDDEIIEDDENSIDVDGTESILFELNTDDIEEEDEYAIFARVYNENEYYEDYLTINLEKKEHEIKIKDFSVEDSYCGDFIDLEIKIENTGKNDEEIFVKIESELFNEKSEEFELDEEDSERIDFYLKVPENVSGDYKIKAEVYYTNKISEEKTINIECKEQKLNKENIEKISIGNVSENAVQESSNLWIIFVIFSVLFIGILIYLLFILSSYFLV